MGVKELLLMFCRFAHKSRYASLPSRAGRQSAENPRFELPIPLVINSISQVHRTSERTSDIWHWREVAPEICL